MASAPPSGGQGDASNAMGPVWMSMALIIGSLIAWFLWHTYLVAFYFHLKLIEIEMIQFFTVALGDTKQFILNTPAETVTMDQAESIAATIGHYLKIPVSLMLMLMAMLLYFKSALGKYKNIYTMKTLAEHELPVWPYLTPVINLSLIDKDLDDGPWAMAMQPMYFAKRYQLLQLEKTGSEPGQLRKAEKVSATLLHNRAVRLFRMQLGALWVNPEKLPIHVKALFAAFAAKALRASQESRLFLEKLSASSGEGKPDFSEVEELFKKYINRPEVVAVTEKHAYVLTVMASVLEFARMDGVLATAEFLWLKPLDRRLWFMLNCVGRRTAFVEVAAPFAHWLAEKEMGRKIVTPMIDEAVKALDQALKEIKYNPDKES